MSSRIRDYDVQRLRLYESAQHHRGPDGTGEYLDDNVYLGHNRLKIIDLTENGRQPMCDESRRFWIVFNGEIYNYLELRKTLQHKYRFRSTTDTEVLLNLVAEKGEGALDEIEGMFAFAIWDAQARNLLLARDRFGEKPLYYVQTANHFAFASELRTLLRTGLASREISPEGLALLPWIGAPYGTTTPVAGVCVLPPSHCLRVAASGAAVPRRYWTVLPSVQPTGAVRAPEVAERVRSLLKESVRQKLISDVPLGLYYSGGLDSNAIAALLREFNTQSVHTYSLGFPFADFDESTEAREGAQYFHFQHTVHELSLRELSSSLSDYLASVDVPVADGVNTYFVSKAARPHFTVALSGMGGDELFGGYSTFRFIALADRLKHFRLPLHAASRWAFLRHGAAPTDWRWRVFLYLLGQFESIEEQYELVRCFFRAEETEFMFDPSFLASLSCGPDSAPKRLASLLGGAEWLQTRGPISKTSLMETRGYLGTLLLPSQDMMSMRFSMEVRAPFLSRALFEYVLSLPDRAKYRMGEQKPLVKAALKGSVAPSVLARRKKRGFGVPLERWVLEKELGEPIHDTLLSRRTWQRGMFSRRFLELQCRRVASWKRHGVVPPQLFMRLWIPFVVEDWLRRNVDAQ